MTSAVQRHPDSPAPATGKRFLTRVILMSAIWLGFTGADWNSWMVGGPVVLAAAWISVKLLPAVTWRWSVGGALAFGGFFLRESLRGGWDVARRALSGRMELRPRLFSFPLRLPVGPARLLFCGSVSLLPGTAVVAIAGDEIHVHVLDQSPHINAELRELERRVATLFGYVLPEERGTIQ